MKKLEFQKITDVAADTKIVPLGASTDSGLPIGYYVLYGPVVVEGGSPADHADPAARRLPDRGEGRCVPVGAIR